MKIDLSNTIAAEMDRALNSDENKQMFSSSSILEKLAFNKVSEDDKVSEIEMEFDSSLKKTAGCHHCECEESKGSECECDCHEENKKKAGTSFISDSVNALLKISEDLDDAGFDKLAAASILLADRLVSEAKAKKSDKKTKESEKAKSKKKVDMKERMKKMREMQNKKKKDSKKTSKKSTEVKKK